MTDRKISLHELESLAAFVAGGDDLYVSGTREDKDGWWAVVWKYMGPGMPGEDVVRHGPFQTQAEAQAEKETWGKNKAGTYNLFK